MKKANNKYYKNGKVVYRIDVSLSGAAARTGNLKEKNSK